MLAHLRRNGANSLSNVRYVLYESSGKLTIVPERGRRFRTPTSSRSSCADRCIPPTYHLMGRAGDTLRDLSGRRRGTGPPPGTRRGRRSTTTARAVDSVARPSRP